MVDYTGKQTMAQRMITSYGRRVTLQAPPTTVANTAQPWRGSSVDGPKKKVVALFLEYETALIDGTDIHRGDQKCLIDEKSLGSNDIRKYDELIEKDGTTWRILHVHTIKPGDTSIYHELQVRR